MSEVTITKDTIVNDAVKEHPHTLYIFKAAGIDTCCGGALAIGEAARRHGIDASELLKSIELATASCACTQ
jgi:iron-sulfur cluster repair protein YtfE (RIC family)